MSSRISATDAARGFSDLVNRVRYRGETFVVERGGEAVCRIGPATPSRDFTAEDLASLLKAAPRPDKAYLDEVEAAVKAQPPVPRSPWPR